MNYIVLDMEWNQAHLPAETPTRKFSIRNEIIEIGAIKLDSDFNEAGEFKRMVKPTFLKKLDSHVKKLTGITAQMLDGGILFPEAIDEFKAWCGEDRAILTWGCDDIPTLVSCLEMYGLDTEWIGAWYNLQLIFNSQTDGGSNQKSLKSALEYYGCALDAAHPWHDALNDAHYAAVVCRHMDLERGIREYSAAKPKKKLLPPQPKAQRPSKRRKKRSKPKQAGDNPLLPVSVLPDNLRRIAETVYPSAVTDGKVSCPAAFAPTPCPLCGTATTRKGWLHRSNGRHVTIVKCKTHGSFFVHMRVLKTEAESTVIRKTICACDEKAEALYDKYAKKNRRKIT